MYEQEVEFLSSVEDEVDVSNQRDLFSKSECLKLKEKFPNIPDEYLAYLQEIGAGTAREQQYDIYADPALNNEDERFSWYQPIDFKDKVYLVIWDDFSGNLYALDINNKYTPVLLDHECMEEFPFKGSIRYFFREMMLLNNDGLDERVS